MLMKQSFTLENDMAMMIDLLSEMVESKNLSQKQLEKIAGKLLNNMKQENSKKTPSKNIVNNIMNYSRALDVLKSEKSKSFPVIIN
jgi:transcriptional regulator NrdR family protein